MKTLNHLLLAAAAVLTVSRALTTQAGEPSTLAKSPQNTVLLASPRYLEAHPELQWTPLSSDQIVAQNISRSDQLKKLTQNKALANSPRFIEQHPGLLPSEPMIEIAPLK